MDARRIIRIAIIVVGAACMLFSGYIAEQVQEGRGQVARGQQQVDTLNSVFSQSKYTKSAGKIITSPAQKRIDEGRGQIAYYDSLANKLQIGGIILVIAGIAMLVIYRKKA